jgi:uncharacterized damage-inducible protein DinB
MANTLTQAFIAELKAESIATRKCLERIPESTYEFKPHEKSMAMGYLVLLVADIPRWIALSIEDSVIDFATYKQFQLSTTSALLKFYEENLKNAEKALSKSDDETLKKEMFYLKDNGQELYSAPKLENISSSINHWIHHRGQLTVYMRLNDIAVPSIYGPSADERTF